MNDVYMLYCRYRSYKRQSVIYAADDTDATFTAIARILNKAVDSDIWKHGRIRLVHEGKLIREMPQYNEG